MFFNGQAEGPHGAPDRRHTRGRGEGVLQLSQRAIRVRRNQRGQGVEVRLKRCFRHQLLLPRPYLVLTKPLRLDIQCQRAASVKIGWKYLDN